ncbi:MAG: glycine betaine ABC transporter substrate-binding protein [Solirubrobacteraceae bacterium]
MAVLTGGLLIGLSTGAASAGHGDTGTTTTAATVREPVVTAATHPTEPAQNLPGTGKPTILLADLPSPEQFIIGQLYELALQQQGYKVELISRNPGTPHLRTAALSNKTLDLYPEYLGTWNSSVARSHRRYRTVKESYAAAGSYARKHGFVLLPPTPFSDTSCVAVLSQYAAANHVYSIPELAARGPVIFGSPLNFQTAADGLPALEQTYHLNPDYVQQIGDGLQYWWLGTGNVDAAYCATTDPALGEPRYMQLQDPKVIFGHGNVVPVTTRAVLHSDGSDFAQTLEKVDKLLTQRAMRGLNAELEIGGHDQTQIAKQFLEGNGILPRSRYAPVPTTTSSTSTQT